MGEVVFMEYFEMDVEYQNFEKSLKTLEPILVMLFINRAFEEIIYHL